MSQGETPNYGNLQPNDWDREGWYPARNDGSFGFIEDDPQADADIARKPDISLVELTSLTDGQLTERYDLGTVPYILHEDVTVGNPDAETPAQWKGGTASRDRTEIARQLGIGMARATSAAVPFKLQRMIDALRGTDFRKFRPIAPEIYQLADVPAPDINTTASVIPEADAVVAPKVMPLAPHLMSLYLDPKVADKLDPTGLLQRPSDEYIAEYPPHPGYDYPERNLPAWDDPQERQRTEQEQTYAEPPQPEQQGEQ